jgi:hypothetical protein
VSTPSIEEIDKAVKELEQCINTPQTKKELWLAHKYDQLAAQLRDMSDDGREQVAKSISRDMSVSIHYAREWIQNLLSD